jgi:glycosyltransferase involved in cell wall biosynthesis
MMPLISVVVPVYQVEKYIRRCLDSVIGQTLREWEMIVVDDGSEDRSGLICDEYTERDSRIRVIHQKNRGLGAARNEGMKQCRGTWLYFLDSDDYLAPEAFFLLYKTVTEKKADLAVAGHNRVESDGRVHCDSSGWPSFSSDADIRTAVIRNSLPNFAWGKLYLRRLWEGISFPENVLVEDMYVLPWVFARASHMAVMKTPLYFYSHENRNSIMNGTGDAYIRIRYGRFGGWRVHEQAAAEVCPEYCGECAMKAIKAGIRALLLNAGIHGLTAWEEQDIRRYLQARNHMALPAGERVMRHLILHRSARLPLLGRLSRELVNKQQTRRMKRLYGAGRGDR